MLNDGLVSRKHAILHIHEDKVVLEDLGSKNGVVLAGQKIGKPSPVNHLDTFAVGGHEMTIIEEGRREELRATARELPRIRMITEHDAEEDVEEDDDTTGNVSGFLLVSSIADKALSLNRINEAERILAKHLDIMLARAMAGASPTHVEEASLFALRLARHGDGGRWVEWVFLIFTALNKVMPSSVIEELQDVVRITKYRDVRPPERYVERLEERAASLSAPERFRYKRMKSLERVIRSRG